METEIKCKAVKRSSFYLSAEGFVLPCCWMALIYDAVKKPEETEIGRIISALPDGFASIDAKKRRVKEIVNGDFFQKIVPSSWARDTNRLAVCARNCGSCDLQSGEFIAR